MRKSLRDEIADAAIQAVFQDYADDIISLDEVMDKLWGMYHPIVRKSPRECNKSELKAVAIWHNERAKAVIRDAQNLVRGTHA